MDYKKEISLIFHRGDDKYLVYYKDKYGIGGGFTIYRKKDILSIDFKYKLPDGKLFEDLLLSNMVSICGISFSFGDRSLEYKSNIYSEHLGKAVIYDGTYFPSILDTNNPILFYEKNYETKNLDFIHEM